MENLNNVIVNNNEKNDNLSKNIILNNENFEILGISKKDEEITINYYGKLLNKADTKNDSNTKTISDDGILYCSEPLKIYMCYGYGNNWDKKENIQMNLINENSKKYYQCKIKIADENTIYFCFMDNSNNWDLNGTSSYHFDVLKNIDYVSKSENDIVDMDNVDDNIFKRFLHNLSTSFLNFLNKLGSLFGNNI